ncbi:GH92 family glycosyl hydrolase [Paraglaciecola sp.]|uniref:GH92 family glycosyl hydrolase n=1 Tax=Paraglaciecola sp. TaxID=1920173 RepID=UPI0030F46AB1
MKIYRIKHSLVLAAALVLNGCGKTPTPANDQMQRIDPLTQVNPFIGTDGKGKTYPGATVPHGMVQLSPDNGRTGWDWISGYFYPDDIIAGFSHTHLSGTGAGDLYDISFMPLTRPFVTAQTEGGPKAGTIVSHFSHEQERASPGYYQVKLLDYDINVELTAGPRTGVQRYQFPATANQGVVRLDLGYSRNWDSTLDTHIELIDEHTLAGYRMSTGWAKDQRVYFYTTLSKPMHSHQLYNGTEALEGKQATNTNLNLQLDFDLSETKQLEVRTALSSVSIANAKANLLAETQHPDFESTLLTAQKAWHTELAQIEIEAEPQVTQQFYTAMYHASLAPRLFSDANGQYKGPDGNIQQAIGHQRYEFFSLWDTFRALHPWKTIVDQTQSKDMLASMMDHYKVAKRLPVWIFQGNETDMMLGYHAVPVLVDAYLKGLGDLDGQQLLDAAIHSATQDKFGIKSYQELGYVPFEEKSWNVSLALEYAYDDWAIAKLADNLGQTKIAEAFYQRAQNYRKLYDSKTGFMRAKDAKGQFREPFDPSAYHPEDYAEANAWQYSFFVPQDIPGLIELMGGDQAFGNKLDAMFNTAQSVEDFPEWISGYIGQYVHGNEPSHHVPYLYQYVAQPHKTQALVRRIMDELYTTQPDGLAGNEDAGQMSAWYLFSALGFYPVDPVSGHYVLGSPAVKQATVHLENGHTFTVKALNQAKQNVYVKQVSYNGKPLTTSYITHQQIMQGGELIFTMSDKAE